MCTDWSTARDARASVLFPPALHWGHIPGGFHSWKPREKVREERVVFVCIFLASIDDGWDDAIYSYRQTGNVGSPSSKRFPPAAPQYSINLSQEGAMPFRPCASLAGSSSIVIIVDNHERHRHTPISHFMTCTSIGQ